MPRQNRKFFIKKLHLALVTSVLFVLLLTIWISREPNLYTNKLRPQPQLRVQEQFLLSSENAVKKDWHDYDAIHKDTQRTGGIGEQAAAATLGADVDRHLATVLSQQFGFNALLSDAISVNRSIKDMRYKGCLQKTYLARLPAVSVLIPFHNEHLSVLLRTVHSIINRTPTELLKEIILIDDYSDINNLGQQLDKYITKQFQKVQLIRLPERNGLIRARLIGARQATAEVLVILDAHVEVNHNWLPPLLEPIALDKRTVVCPIIDSIHYDTFEYEYVFEHGARGGFDWNLRYIQVELLPQDRLDHAKPYKNPIMNGGLFAISAEFFWELGGYDEGLDTWGGEQLELSFKIWMCGGQLLDAPCSRIGHLFRDSLYSKESYRSVTSLLRNYKRVAEVWMDEYKNYVYRRNPTYATIDAGDLTAQKALRKKLKCKSFDWFMKQIAFDLEKEYPSVEPPHYASGAIQNVAFPNLCMDTLNREVQSKVGLRACSMDRKNPQYTQNFALTWRNDLRAPHCLDVQDQQKNAPIQLWFCHHRGGNQFWYYDHKKKWLINGGTTTTHHRCVEASPYDLAIYMNACEENNLRMQWNFGFVNYTALEGFFKNKAL